MKRISLLVLVSSLSAQTTIAVVDFEAKGVSNDEASALSDRLRNELTEFGEYTVVERSQMEEVLKEQGFQQSGCVSNECAVEVGELVGVQQIVVGSISRVGDVMSVSARIVSVETGTVLTAASYDHEGKIGDLLKTGMNRVALDLAGIELISDQTSIFLETRIGIFSPEIENFNKIYGNDAYLSTLVVGLGANQNFLVARYNLYEETGQSVVTGIDLDGDASWHQEFITIGLRSYDQTQTSVYLELAYSIGKAKETITTEMPEYTALNSSWNAPDIRGGAIALGFKFIDFGMGFQFSGEIGYVHLPVTTADDKEINIGGRQLSLGLTWGM